MEDFVGHDADLRRGLRDDCRMPQHYYIDIGNYCNLRCPFCVTGAKETQAPQGFMTLEKFSIIFDRIRADARLISLYNWGEPLMNKDLLGIIRLAASDGAKVHIDTNLSVSDFSESYCDQLVQSGLYSLFASIDGMSQENYARYRVRGNLQRVLANLNKLLAAKQRLGSDLPILGWQFHVNAFNEHEISAAAEKAARMGVGIVFKRLNSPDPSWHSSLHQQALMVLRGADWFQAAYNPPQNPDHDQISMHPAVAHPCGQLFNTMTVAWNGAVMPCTYVEGQDFAIGNLIDQPLAEVWNGPEFRKSRDFVLHYGPQQNGGSICERLRCPLVDKHLPGDTAAPVVAAV